MKAEIKNRVSISTELHNLRQNRAYMLIMTLLLVSALVWVLMTVVATTDDSEVTTKAIKYAVPINPNIDVTVFATVENKRYLSESELEAFPINQLIKDRSGDYFVVPFDTTKEQIELLKTTGKAISKPISIPTAAKSASTSSTSTTKQ